MNRFISTRAKLLRNSALGLALAFGAAGTVALAPQAALAQKGPSISKAFQTEIVKVQAAFDASKAPEADEATKAQSLAAARAALPAAKAAIDATNAQDKLFYGNFAYNIGRALDNVDMQREGLDYMIQAGSDDPARLAQLQKAAGQLAYNADDYEAARRYFNAAIAGGDTDPQLTALTAESYFAQQQYPQGFEVLSNGINSIEAAGGQADEAWYRRAVAVAYQNDLGPQAMDWVTRYAATFPSKDSWGDAIVIIRDLGNYDGQGVLDLLRLMDRTETFRQKNDIFEYVEVADPRRLPGEVVEVIDTGIAVGLVDANDPVAMEWRADASGRISADRASLPELERDALAASSTARTAMAAGDAFLSYGMSEKAEAVYRAALTRDGVDMPRMLTRLGIALVDQGKYAEAQEVFGQVEGPRKRIADLWAAYAAQQAG